METRQELNIVSHVVSHIKCSRFFFPDEGGNPPKIWKIELGIIPRHIFIVLVSALPRSMESSCI